MSFKCVIITIEKGSCMERHPSNMQYLPSSTFQNPPSQETEGLQGEVEQKTTQQHQTETLPPHRRQWQGVQIDKCSKYLYILMLVALAVFISSEFLLDHRLNIKQSDKFTNNINKLKKQTHMSKGQQSLRGNRVSKPDAYSTLSSSINSQQPYKNHPTVITRGISNAILPNRYNPNTPSFQPTNPVNNQNNVGRGPSTPYSAGHGISQALLSRVKVRRSLMALPFNQTNEVSQEELNYYQHKYQTGNYSELPFCLVIPTYNNVKNDRYLKNIRSVIMQNYTNYHVVIIDDASTDGTGGLILSFLRSQSVLPKERYDIIRNQQQMRAMYNIRFAATHYCKPHEIFMIVDGDDQLLGRQVLKLFNAKFQADQLYFMYTNFLTLSGRVGYSRAFPQRIIKGNLYRKYPFVTSHLRAFYTQLFLNVKEEDLRDEQGEYLRAANDVAICIPILEQAHTRVGYVPELTYLYNSNTGLNNHALRLKEQRSNDKKVRTHKNYEAVVHLFGEK